MTYSVVIPVYLNEATLPTVVEQLTSMQGELDEPLEAVFVVDGSPDGSSAALRDLLPHAPFTSQLVVLSRNFGAFSAIRAGLMRATGDYCAVMAADLQEPPELLIRFFEILARDEADVVVGTRQSRRDPLPSRLASKAFWWLYRTLVDPNVPPGGVDVFGGNRQFVDELVRLEESNSSLVGLLFWLGFRRAEVPYQRLPRPEGRSAWSWRRRLTYLMDSLFSFSDLPVRLLILLGSLGLVVAAAVAAVVVVVRLTAGYPVPGYAMTVVLISFFAGLNSLGLGLVGAYAWRAYENTKNRPGYLIMRTDRYGREDAS